MKEIVHCWQALRVEHSDGAFTGESSAKSGGRWNSPGIKVVYLSQCLSLALLELMAHLEPDEVDKPLVWLEGSFARRQLEVLADNELPHGWQHVPPIPATQRIGDDWVKQRRSLALSVPSVIVPNERNILVNPAHDAFAELMRSPPTPIRLDLRCVT